MAEIINYLRDAINSGIVRDPGMVVCGMAIAATNGQETHRYKKNFSVLSSSHRQIGKGAASGSSSW